MSDTFLFLKLALDDSADAKFVQGESDAVGYENLIELESFDWGFKGPKDPDMVPTGTDASQVAATNRPQGEAFGFTKHYDTASSALNCAMRDGTKFTRGTLYVVMVETASVSNDSGQERLLKPMLDIELIDVRVDSLEMQSEDGGANSVRLVETVKLSYENMAMIYYPPADFDPSGYAQNVGRTGEARVQQMPFGGPVNITGSSDS